MNSLVDKFYNIYLTSTIVILSIITTIILCIVLNRKQTNFSKIMNYIVLSETIMVYSEFMMFIKYNKVNTDETWESTINTIYNKISYFLFFSGSYIGHKIGIS